VLGSIAAILAFAAWIALSGSQRMLMNGELTQAHASLEQGCESCHQPWSGVQADKCLTCHGPVVLGKNHHGVAQVCSTCHREHQGRTFQLTKIDVRQCVACHGDVLTPGRHPPESAQQCLLCHGQHLPRTFARTVSSDLVMSHRTHVQNPGLVQAACSVCHALAPDPALIRYPSEPVCRTCHFGYVHDTSQDIRAKECRLCHRADHVAVLTRQAGFATLRFSHGEHVALACEECHTEMGVAISLAEVTLPGVETCKKCH
jgi:hypothetical protein